jgi:hypothetical protein
MCIQNRKKMQKQILEFRKTDHFLFSQWDRSIDDQMLYKILRYVKCTKCEKDVVLVLPSFLKKKGLAKDEETCLVLIVKRNLILTGYWCDHPNYLFTKEKNSHFQILY